MFIFKRLLPVNHNATYYYRIMFNFLLNHIIEKDSFEIDCFRVRECNPEGAVSVSFILKTSKRKGYDATEVEDMLNDIKKSQIETKEDIIKTIRIPFYKSYRDDDRDDDDL